MKKLFPFLLLLLFAGFVQAQQAHQVTFMHEGKTVFGTFTTPAGSGPFPTIIINPGTGANDRNGTVAITGANAQCLYPGLLGQTLTPYQDLAQALTDSGYAVLRYDKLEYTYPTSLGAITFEKLWLPVESAIDYLKTRPDVDAGRLILIGHSEGSMLVPYIARRKTGVKALISLAGARTPFDTLYADQIVRLTRQCNGDTVQAKQQAAQVLLYFDYVRKGNTAGLPPAFGVPAAEWVKYIRVNDSVSMNYNLNNLPKLFVGMGDDFNVPPAELVRFQQELTGRTDFYSMAGLNHFMTTATQPQISKALTDTVVYWLRQQNLVTGVKKPKHTQQQVYVSYSPGHFSVHASAAILQVNVYDMTGRKVRALTAPATGAEALVIPKQELAQGVLLVEVLTEKGVAMQKVLNR